ncbi:MAG: LacI family DNA-binding transcriptional regulator [Mycobacterium sp.]|nr:LacI family DNA-binding transcriptional regulator [Mycobacterium sp.]
MTATIRDVARVSGVHPSTVSRALSAPDLVNAATRARVLSVADQLGYQPNRAARALITGRTHNVGLIVADIANPFFPPLIKAAEHRARLRGHHLFIADTDEDPAAEEELVRTLTQQVDGLLLCSPRLSNTRINALRTQVPMVVVNRSVPGLSSVLTNVAGGARQAIEHLVRLGHREIAFLAGPRGSWTNREIRRAASVAARAEATTVTPVGPNNPTEDGGAAAADMVLATKASAVLAYNDLMAIGLIEAVTARGVQVPEQLSVIGFDDIALSRRIRPKLTTVATPSDEAGRLPSISCWRAATTATHRRHAGNWPQR